MPINLLRFNFFITLKCGVFVVLFFKIILDAALSIFISRV